MLNPHSTLKRTKIDEQLRKAGIKLGTIEDLKVESHSLASPMSPELISNITTLIEYRDGTYLDVIYQIVD